MNKPMMNAVETGHAQQGAVLIVSLVMLLLLTFIGVAAMNTTNTQEKMVGNLQDQQVAFEMAELALKEGEAWLLGRSDLPEPSTDPAPGDGFVWARDAIKDKLSAPKASWWDYATDTNFWTAEGNPVDLDTALVRADATDTSWFVYQEPQYVIELLQTISGAGGTGSASIGMSDGSVSSTIFRIVARGMGGRQDTVVLLEGIYGKQ